MRAWAFVAGGLLGCSGGDDGGGDGTTTDHSGSTPPTASALLVDVVVAAIDWGDERETTVDADTFERPADLDAVGLLGGALDPVGCVRSWEVGATLPSAPTRAPSSQLIVTIGGVEVLGVSLAGWTDGAPVGVTADVDGFEPVAVQGVVDLPRWTEPPSRELTPDGGERLTWTPVGDGASWRLTLLSRRGEAVLDCAIDDADGGLTVSADDLARLGADPIWRHFREARGQVDGDDATVRARARTGFTDF